jgi:hypothetical protein
LFNLNLYSVKNYYELWETIVCMTFSALIWMTYSMLHLSPTEWINISNFVSFYCYMLPFILCNHTSTVQYQKNRSHGTWQIIHLYVMKLITYKREETEREREREKETSSNNVWSHVFIYKRTISAVIRLYIVLKSEDVTYSRLRIIIYLIGR